MNSNNKKLYQEEIVLKGVLSHVWKNKILILVITLCFTLYHGFKDTDKNEVFTIKTTALIKKPPEHIFVNFVNTNEEIFNNLYKQSTRSIVSSEIQSYHNIFSSKFLSLDNFLIFLKSNDEFLKLYDEINFEKKSGLYTEKKIGFTSYEEVDEKEETSKKIAEEVFVKLSSQYDGVKILTDYIIYVSNDTNQTYVKQKLSEFELVLNKFENALKVSRKIGLEFPFYLKPQLTGQLNDLSLLVYDPGDPDLYLKGSKILESSISQMVKLIENMTPDSLYFNPILDSAHTISAKKVVEGRMSNIIRGVFSGFFVSLIIVYLKSLMITNRKTINRRRN